MPPPVHGASIMGSYIINSKLVSNNLQCKYINLSASKKLEEVGLLNINKLFFLPINFFNILITALRFNPDIIYLTPSSWDWGFYRDFIVVSTLKFFNFKVLLHFQNKGSKTWLSKKRNKFLMKLYFNKLKIILLGKSLYDEKAPYINKKDVYFCPNCAPEPIFNQLLETKKTNETVNFLYLGNMIIEKGPYDLLEACKVLVDKGYKFNCKFVGGWKDINEIEFRDKLISLQLNEYVCLLGPKYDNEKIEILKNSDVFVFPTYYHGECFPLVLIEAMSYSLPAISTNEGAISEIIVDNETGFIVDSKNIESIAEKMEYFILNPNMIKVMGEKAKNMYDESFTLNKFENNILNIISECIDQKY